MLNSVEYTEHFFNKIKSNRQNNYVLSNMRMSICELG